MKIYFAASIRSGRQDKELFLQIIKHLEKYGTVLTEHIGDHELTTMGDQDLPDPEIYERDMEWLNAADVVVAEVTTPSLGVGYEIGQMEGKKPIFCLYREQPDRRLSAMLSGNAKLQIKSYEGIKDAQQLLDEFFSGRSAQM